MFILVSFKVGVRVGMFDGTCPLTGILQRSRRALAMTRVKKIIKYVTYGVMMIPRR